jgi:hypothetical protein
MDENARRRAENATLMTEPFVIHHDDYNALIAERNRLSWAITEEHLAPIIREWMATGEPWEIEIELSKRGHPYDAIAHALAKFIADKLEEEQCAGGS